jgi:hypothetical protein
MTTEQQTNNKTKNWAIAGIIISWITFWMFLFSPFGLLAWIGILIYLIGKKSKLKLYFILSAWLFVPSCSFLTGTVRYATGNASLQGLGGPRTYHGIDRDTRVVSTSSGCIFVGYEPFVFPANNLAVELWTNLFGFQRGSYKGSFPTEEEAQSIIKSADTIVVERTGKYLEFKMANQIVKFDTSDLYRSHHSTISSDTVIGKIIKNECFIFQQVDRKEKDNGNEKTIFVVDIAKNKLLTSYFDY